MMQAANDVALPIATSLFITSRVLIWNHARSRMARSMLKDVA